MRRLQNLIDKGRALTTGRVFYMGFSPVEMQKYVIWLNQNNQLQFGKLPNGQTLPDYSERSVSEFGKRPGPWTLENTGEFYASMLVAVSEDAIELRADTAGKGAVEFAEMMGGSLGLTEESAALLIEKVLPELRAALLKHLLT